MYKNQVQKAIENFSRKQLPKPTRAKRTTPEKSITEPEVLEWCAEHGFDVTVIDSSTFGVTQGLVKTSESMPDLCGNVGSLSVWIELKAPGGLSGITWNQHRFLTRKIEQGCFAVCVDSAKLLNDHWGMFNTLKDPKEYLLEMLPESAEVRKEKAELLRPLFDE